MDTDKITIEDKFSHDNPDDACSVTMNCQDAAELCLRQADALPDGAPEQVSVLLRGVLAAQLGMVQMLMLIVNRLDAWPDVHDLTCTNPRCPGCG